VRHAHGQVGQTVGVTPAFRVSEFSAYHGRVSLPAHVIAPLVFGLLFCAHAHADPRALAASGKHAEAAAEIGTAIAKAQKKNDLLAEQRLWTLSRKILADADARTVWAALMEPLDPKRSGAFVSAQLLAERLVFACIEQHDTAHLEAATAVLGTRAKAKGAGRHTALVLRLAQSVAAEGAGAADVCVEAAKQGWPELAGMAAIAVFDGQRIPPGDAQRAEDAVVGAMIAAGDSGLAMAWAQPIKRRLQGSAHAVSAVARVMQKIGAILVQPLGAPSGANGKTALAKAWRRLGKKKTIASLSRRDDLLLEQQFEKFKTTLKPRSGLKLHSHGGLHLGLNRFGVTVRLLDVDGAGSAGDDAEVPGPFDLVYRIARDETWVLTRSGVQVR